MRHYGDIKKISGWDLPVVDCITGGSPCQDLSVAGPRDGLKGKRSGLFMEQIRIVKEMRWRDRAAGRTGVYVRPRYMVWENVLGAFSSNKGRDFQAVLTEIARIAEPDAPDVPMHDKGKWPHARCIYSEMGNWSIAWRLHDAQFWRVPQRRKRISLVADFGGLSAPEILFERKGLSRDLEPSEETRERDAAGAESGTDSTEPILLESNQNHATIRQDGICSALPASMGMGGGYVPMVAGFKHKASWQARSIGYEEEKAQTLISGQEIAVYENNGQDSRIKKLGDICESVSAKYGTGGNNTPLVLSIGNGQLNQMAMNEQANALDTMHDQQAIMVCCPEIAHCLKGKSAVDHREDSETYVCSQVVRRLTPLECERLQGYPDGWTNIGDWIDSKGKKHKIADSQRYKAIGNSIALPFWFWLLRRISAQYERPATLGSLFDGIGGFPLCWERCNGPGTAIWASEVEEFCIAVTKKHFPEVNE